MIAINSNEAILFRILVAFFGEDRVVPHMSLMAVCGGALPGNLNAQVSASIETSVRCPVPQWARKSKCLFTIVNEQNDPRMVIEFVPENADVVDVAELERQHYMRPILEAAGIPYLTMSQDEFSDIVRPGSGFDLVAFLQSKYECPSEG